MIQFLNDIVTAFFGHGLLPIFSLSCGFLLVVCIKQARIIKRYRDYLVSIGREHVANERW